MPQLMPLNWMNSSMALIVVLVVGMLMYSNSSEVLLIYNKKIKEVSGVKMWSW